jgi:hypothetical protein
MKTCDSLRQSCERCCSSRNLTDVDEGVVLVAAANVERGEFVEILFKIEAVGTSSYKMPFNNGCLLHRVPFVESGAASIVSFVD